MRIEASGAQVAMEQMAAAQQQAAEVVTQVASGNLDAAPAMMPAELELAISVEVFGKVLDVQQSMGDQLVNMISQIDISI